MATIQAVIFDMGGVILRTENSQPRIRLGERLGKTRSELEELVFGSESSHAAEEGRITQAAHWIWVGEQLGLSSEELEEFQKAFWSGDRVDLALVDFIRSLRPTYKTALLSNAWDGTRKLVEAIYDFTDAFDLAVFSAEVRLRKPDRAAFQLVLDRLGVLPEAAVFVDDFAINIEAAQRYGLRTVHFQKREQAEQDLLRLLNG